MRKLTFELYRQRQNPFWKTEQLDLLPEFEARLNGPCSSCIEISDVQIILWTATKIIYKIKAPRLERLVARDNKRY